MKVSPPSNWTAPEPSTSSWDDDGDVIVSLPGQDGKFMFDNLYGLMVGHGERKER